MGAQLTTVPTRAVDTRANLWAEAESLLKPGAIVTLTCQSVLRTQEFQLFKDGVPQEPVRLDSPAFEHRFLLGAVINDTRGLYRCRYSTDGGWMGLSNLVELTGTGEWSANWPGQSGERLLERPPVLHSSVSLSSSCPTPGVAGGLGQVR